MKREVRESKTELAQAIAERLVTIAQDAVRERGVCHLVLTGGSMGSATLEALGTVLRNGSVSFPWEKTHLWWGDERFLPSGDPERNETQARDALLDVIDIPAGQIHAMGALPAEGDAAAHLEQAAKAYADDLRQAHDTVADSFGSPVFDVVMLGMGPDTHVASLFPGQATTRIENALTAAVHDSPKPPPARITLTFPALNHAREVWLMIAGADKADAVAAASSSSDATAHPASGVHGRDETIWWLDAAAANSADKKASS